MLWRVVEGIYQDLVEEVLDELLLKRPRGEEAMEISAEEFRHCLLFSILSARNPASVYSPTYMSSRGEMKMSLRLMTCTRLLSMPALPQRISSFCRGIDSLHFRA